MPRMSATPGTVERRRFEPARFWHGRDLAIAYAAVVIVVSVVVALQPAGVARAWVAQSSTNLDNMSRNPALVLALSAFVVAPLWYLLLLIPLVIAYGEVQRWLGRLALVVTVIFSHVGASLVVMTAETVALTQRAVPSSIAERHDVGVSYGLAGALGLLLVRVPPRLRVWYGLASVVGVVALIVFSSVFSALGHGSAWLIGIGLSWLAYAAASRAATSSAKTSGSER